MGGPEGRHGTPKRVRRRGAADEREKRSGKQSPRDACGGNKVRELEGKG